MCYGVYMSQENTITDIIIAMLMSSRSTRMYRKILWERLQKRRQCSRQAYNQALYRLNKNGTISLCMDDIELLKKYSAKISSELAVSVKKPSSAGRVLVSFDIPETKRKQIILSLEQAVPKPIEREAMSIEDIKSLSRLPQVTIGAHGVHHALLANCNSSELDFELKESKSKLEEWTGKEVKFFAYPHGSVNNDVKEALQKVGFTLAATLEKKPISVEDDPYFIPRYGVNDEAFFPESICQIVGVWWKFLKYFPFF